MAAPQDPSIRNLEDGRRQALHALVSSLAPEGANESRKLSDAQVDALSAKLEQILGSAGDCPAERRNEKGQLLNEEGLPIIDISESVADISRSSHTPETFVSESDPIPLSRLSDMERMRMRARTNHILDALEMEEEQAARAERERERSPSEPAHVEAEAARKLAAREMQKRMGKALLKNLAEQREQEERARNAAAAAEAETARLKDAGSGLAPARATIKPRKSVSFANVPEVDRETPKAKPSAAWGDLSLGALRAGVPKAKLKSEMLSGQPMKLEVVERVPGQRPESSANQEQDSDDESNPELPQEEEDDEEEETPPLDGDFDDSGASAESDEDPEDELDFAQASLQREVALEYFRLRESIGADAHKAMTAHSHEGEDEWDKPEVPLEASLASKPAKPGISRFKADRQTNRVPQAPAGSSVSLGASVIPKERSDVLQKVVRTGKIEDGHLVGLENDSASEGEEDENRKRTLGMLKAGITVTTSPGLLNVPQSQSSQVSPSSPIPVLSPGSAPPPSASKFLAERATYKKPEQQPVAGPSKLRIDSPVSPAPIAGSVVERSASASSLAVGKSRAAPDQPTPPFRKPPTTIAVPQKFPPQSQPQQQQASRRPFAAPQVQPDPAVLATMIIDSPSFPASLSSNTAPASGSRAIPALVDEVRESTRGPGRGEPPAPTPSATAAGQAPARVSRFKAERM